jgi:hypothetical protein
MITQFFIVLFGVFVILQSLRFNHRIIEQIEKDFKNFKRVCTLEKSSMLKNTLLLAKHNEYELKIEKESGIITIITVLSIIGEVICYFYLNIGYFLLMTFFILLNLISHISLRANLIRSKQGVESEIRKHNKNIS